MVPIPIWKASSARIGVTGLTESEHLTQEDLKQFRRWALRNGFKLTRYFNNESIKRAYRLIGTGEYAGLLFSVINRVMLSQEHPSRFGKRYRKPMFDYTKPHRPKIGECWDGRHNRDDCDVIIDCSISGFFHNTNLLGYYGITFQEVRSMPVSKIHEILMAPPRYRSPRAA